MGILSTLATIKDAALLEFGAMGHMLYAKTTLERMGVIGKCDFYSTHIDESDIALGSTVRFEEAVTAIIRDKNPKALFILPSSTGQMIGTDMEMLCIEMQEKYPDTPIVFFNYGNFVTMQHEGIEKTLLYLTKTFARCSTQKEKKGFNIIGSCADLFNFQADARELVRIMEGAFGIAPICTMTSNMSIEDLALAPDAKINLVLRREGVLAAKYLQEKFGTPFIYARAYGFEQTTSLLHHIAKEIHQPIKEGFIEKEYEEGSVARKLGKRVLLHQREKGTLSLGGHKDVVEGILSYGIEEVGLQKGVCWCDAKQMGTEGIPYLEESEWVKALSQAEEGILMASKEVLNWKKKNTRLQIAGLGDGFIINPYVSPYIGYRGAMHLASLWIEEVMG
jgi:nitrogenase molybdenum-iron protein alpha/beta subunit